MAVKEQFNNLMWMGPWFFCSFNSLTPSTLSLFSMSSNYMIVCFLRSSMLIQADTSWFVICESFQLSMNNYGYPFIRLNPHPLELRSSVEHINPIISCLFWLAKVQMIQGLVAASIASEFMPEGSCFFKSCVIQFQHMPYLLLDYGSHWVMFYLFIYEKICGQCLCHKCGWLTDKKWGICVKVIDNHLQLITSELCQKVLKQKLWS